MKKAVMAMWILLLLVAILSPLKTAFAASDGYYQLSAVTYEWDGTDANRTKATNSKYYYTYGDEYSIGYRLPWVVESYGRYYPYIAADTNGNLWFSVGSWRLGNSFDLANSGGPVISAWNNDLSSYYYGGVYIQYKTNPERVVIEWQAETYIEEGLYKPNNFEIVFFKNGDARIDYKSFSTTVGKDFGSGISKGDGVHYINLSTAFDKPFNLAGKSFLFAKLYNVTASTNGNGTITPISTATTYGGSSTFAITPADGYLLTSLTDNGVDVTASVSNNSYTITNVTANHTVMATFNKLICTVSSSVSGGNGSVSPASTTVNSGHNTIVTVTPAPGYRLALLYDNKASVTERVSNNTYTIANVITDHAIVAVFTEITNPTFSPKLSAWEHNIALKRDGTVLTWGYNSSGQLGNGTTANGLVPTSLPVPEMSDVVAVAAGANHTVALKKDGTVFAWGGNYSGQLGDGTTTSHYTPMPVPELTGVTAIAAGGSQTFALKSDGTVWAWGNNYYGQLGDGTTTYRYSPINIPALNGIVAIACGQDHTVALKNDGTVLTWGRGANAVLGDGTSANRYIPAQVPDLNAVVAISAGPYNTMALKNDGTIMMWGANSTGQIGDGTTTICHRPKLVPGLSGVTAISMGDLHTVALKNDGKVFSWGYNSFGQLGDGTSTTRYVPTEVLGASGVVAIGAGYNHTVALRNDGAMISWGKNYYGEVGDGTTTSRSLPVVTGFYFEATTLPLNVNFAGTGSGTVTSTPAGVDCNANCSSSFPSGTQVTLHPAASPASVFVGWTNGTCSGTGDCVITMNASTAVTANFDQATPGSVIGCAVPVRIPGKGDFASLQAAYDVAADGDIILAAAQIFVENLAANRPIGVTLDGGYSCDYSSNGGMTVIVGEPRLSSGAVKMKNVRISK